MTGKEFAGLLEAHGFDFFTGVPCSLLADVPVILDHHPRLPYITSVREDASVGLAAGAWFGGRQPALLIQNSGLGTSFNALASLALMYKLPSLMVVTWRGYGGKDAPEHILTGATTPQLLDLLGMVHRTLSRETASDDIAWAAREMVKRMEPVALLLPPTLLEGAEGESPEPGSRDAAAFPVVSTEARIGAPTLSRIQAIRRVVPLLSDEPVIHANGYICRESFAVSDRPQNFYMIGSMGLASAIGLGLALTTDRTVVVFDGDGNLLMNLGVLPMVGATRPRNFVHFVFDNEMYGSTGNQRSLSSDIRLDHLAAAAGYRRSVSVTTADRLDDATRQALKGDGPSFILVKVNAAEEDVPRIPYPPEAIRDRFKASLRR